MDNDISRRTFARIAALGALSTALPNAAAAAEAEQQAVATSSHTFPNGLL